MAIDSKLPEINELRNRVEKSYGSPLSVHSDFETLAEDIFLKTKEYISVTTLERLWNYSTRGSETVMRRTLDVLCRYSGLGDWEAFRRTLKEEGVSESEMFDEETVTASELRPGDRIRIGWQPDRIAVIRYLGDNRFMAEETHNSKLMRGDTFTCLQFQLHGPLYVTNLTDAVGAPKGASYGMGLRHGLTILQLQRLGAEQTDEKP